MREDVYTTRQYCILRILSQTIEPIGGYATDSVTHGQCDARPTVTFSANGRYQFILLGEQRHTVCGQVAQSRYVNRSGRQCDARPTVTFSANGRCQFILLGEQRHTVCGQVAQSRYVNRSGRDSNLRLL